MVWKIWVLIWSVLTSILEYIIERFYNRPQKASDTFNKNYFCNKQMLITVTSACVVTLRKLDNGCASRLTFSGYPIFRCSYVLSYLYLSFRILATFWHVTNYVLLAISVEVFYSKLKNSIFMNFCPDSFSSLRKFLYASISIPSTIAVCLSTCPRFGYGLKADTLLYIYLNGFD